MALTKLTKEGQMTIPSEIRELSGMLYRSTRTTVSVAEMNKAISETVGESI